MSHHEVLLWIKEIIAIFFLTFVHEDAAIVAAGFAKVERGLPLVYAFLPVYLGIVSGDLFIYSLGRLAQTNKWLRSKIIGNKVEKLGAWIEKNLVRILVMCRITPGLLFPTFVACGWFRIPFWRFATVSIVAGAVYSSIMLTIMILFGDLVLYKLGYRAWGLIVAVVVIYAIRNSLKSNWSKKTESIVNKNTSPFMKILRNYIPTGKTEFSGMPSLKNLRKFVSTAERIPNNILYIPIGFRWLLLALKYRSLTLPSASNPMIVTGGFMGESKASVLNMVGEQERLWIAKYVLVHRNDDTSDAFLQHICDLMTKEGFNFPVVAKPDIGWNGYGVRFIENKGQLKTYIEEFPVNADFIVQEAVNYDGEAGIFYVRIPGEEKGYIYSITLRYFPFVKGDGKSTLRQLIENDRRARLRSHLYLGNHPKHVGFSEEDLNRIPREGELVRLAFIGSLRAGGLYQDASHLITPELTERFDRIARSMPEFFYGRFDVRFESIELLKKGEGFKIIEINGAGAEAIQAWDPDVPLTKLYREFFKAQSLLFKVADLNRKRGFKPMKVKDFLNAIRHQNRLVNIYPPAS